MRLLSPAVVSVLFLLSCGPTDPPPLDCRTLGCEPGFVCTELEGGAYACRPVEPEPCTPGSCPRLLDDPRMCQDGACVPCEPDLSGAIWNTDAGDVVCSTPERPVKSWHPDWECPRLTEPCDAEPPPVSCPRGFPQGQDDNMTGGAIQTDWAIAVDLAMHELTGCAIGDWTCSTGMSPDDWMHAVIEKLQQAGLCAGRHVDTTPGGTDEIAVTDDCTGWWEGYKVYNYTPGQRLIWSAQGKRPAWKLNEPGTCGNPTDPPVDPPPGGECVDPDPSGREAEFKVKKHHQDLDATYRVKGRDYCDAVCSPLEPNVCFTGRLWCPLRFEGDPERKVCEAQEIGVQQWWCDGTLLSPCVPGVDGPCVRENRAQARCHGRWKTCTENGRTCADGDW